MSPTKFLRKYQAMRSLFFALALLTATPALASDARVFETIYRGKAVDRAGLSWKSTVSLNFDSPDGKWYACSGVFIAQDVILTAAHCRIKDEGTVQIKLFKENSPSATIIYAEGKEFQYRAHPRYRKGAYDAGTDDIGVLVLKNARLPEDFLPNPILQRPPLLRLRHHRWLRSGRRDAHSPSEPGYMRRRFRRTGFRAWRRRALIPCRPYQCRTA
jgi:hypothetical protein